MINHHRSHTSSYEESNKRDQEVTPQRDAEVDNIDQQQLKPPDEDYLAHGIRHSAQSQAAHRHYDKHHHMMLRTEPHGDYDIERYNDDLQPRQNGRSSLDDNEYGEEEEEEEPPLSSSTTTNKCNNMISLGQNNLVIAKMLPVHHHHHHPHHENLSPKPKPSQYTFERSTTYRIDPSQNNYTTVAIEQNQLEEGDQLAHLHRQHQNMAHYDCDNLMPRSRETRGRDLRAADLQQAQQQSGGQPAGGQQSPIIEMSSQSTMRHDAQQYQITVNQFIRSRPNDSSIREEEVNETFEEYESQPFNIGYTAATGLHSRMAQLTNYTTMGSSTQQQHQHQQRENTTNATSNQPEVNASRIVDAMTMIQQNAQSNLQQSLINMNSVTRGCLLRNTNFNQQQQQFQQISGPDSTNATSGMVGLRSATCSPAMGGRKTIMNLPNRFEQTTKGAFNSSSHQIGTNQLTNSGGGPSAKAVSSMTTIEDHTGDSDRFLLETTKKTFMNSIAPTQLIRNQLHSISEQNESSKPTSKMENNSLTHQYHQHQQQNFLSSMVTTMRSVHANLGPQNQGGISPPTYQSRQTQQMQMVKKDKNNLMKSSASGKTLSASVPSKRPIRSREEAGEQQMLVKRSQVQLNQRQELQQATDETNMTSVIQSPVGDATNKNAKQYPTRVMINLDNPKSKPLPPILTSSVETMQSQSQLTVQQKNFTFNETPSSAQQPQIAAGLKNSYPLHLTAASSPLNSVHGLAAHHSGRLGQQVFPATTSQSAHNSLTRSHNQLQIQPAPLLSPAEPPQVVLIPYSHHHQLMDSQQPMGGHLQSDLQGGIHQTHAATQWIVSHQTPVQPTTSGQITPQSIEQAMFVPPQQQCRTTGTRTPIPLKPFQPRAKNKKTMAAQVPKKHQPISIKKTTKPTAGQKHQIKHQQFESVKGGQTSQQQQHLYQNHTAEYFSLMNNVDVENKDDIGGNRPTFKTNENNNKTTTMHMQQKQIGCNIGKNNQKRNLKQQKKTGRNTKKGGSNRKKNGKERREITTESYLAGQGDGDGVDFTEVTQTKLDLHENMLQNNESLEAQMETQMSNNNNNLRLMMIQDGVILQPVQFNATQQPQQMQTPLFGNRAAAMLAPFTAVTTSNSQQHSMVTSPQSTTSPRPTPPAQYFQDAANGAIYLGSFEQLPQEENTNRVHPAQQQVSHQHQQINKNQFQNYMLLQQQSRLIGQIRRDIQTRKIQQDQRAKVISRILADQDHQKSLLAAEESSVSLMSRNHRRSLSVSHENTNSYTSQNIALSTAERHTSHHKLIPQVSQNNQKYYRQQHDRSNSSFVSSFACSFVLEKDYCGGNGIIGASSNAPASALQLQQATIGAIVGDSNLKASVVLHHPSQQQNQITNEAIILDGLQVSAPQAQSIQHRSRTTVKHGGDVSMTTSQYAAPMQLLPNNNQPNQHKAGVSSESLNALQSYYGAGSNAVNVHHCVLTSDEFIMQSSRTMANRQQAALLARGEDTTSSHPTTARYHASSQSQAVRQKKHQKSNGQQTTSSQLTINASQVYGVAGANQRSFGDTVQGNYSRVLGGTARTQARAQTGGVTTPYLFHQSPIELRSQAADSMNINHVFQQQLRDDDSKGGGPLTHRHFSDMRRDCEDNNRTSIGAEDAGVYQPQTLVGDNIHDDEEGLFDRDSQGDVADLLRKHDLSVKKHQNLYLDDYDQDDNDMMGQVEEDEDKTVLLETAGFLPLKNIAQQIVHQIETANSSERPPVASASQIEQVAMPYPQQQQVVPDHELFYAIQQQGVLPSENQEKGVQTTTSFLEVSICKTPKAAEKNTSTSKNHNTATRSQKNGVGQHQKLLSKSRNAPAQLLGGPLQQHSQQPVVSSTLSQQMQKVLKMSQTCRLEPNKRIDPHHPQRIKQKPQHQLETVVHGSTANNTSHHQQRQHQEIGNDWKRKEGVQSHRQHHQQPLAALSHQQQAVNSRCVLPSRATRTNLKDLPTSARTTSTNTLNNNHKSMTPLLMPQQDMAAQSQAQHKQRVPSRDLQNCMARQQLSSSISHEMIQPKMSSFQSSLARKKSAIQTAATKMAIRNSKQQNTNQQVLPPYRVPLNEQLLLGNVTEEIAEGKPEVEQAPRRALTQSQTQDQPQISNSTTATTSVAGDKNCLIF